MKVMGRRRKFNGRRCWERLELSKLKRLYPHQPSVDVAAALGRTLSSINAMAAWLGLRKTARYLASPAAHRFDGLKGIGTRFRKGHRPWNAGMKGWKAGGRSKLTRFKRGHRPWDWQPVGHERVTKDGVLQRKVTDTGYTPRDYKAVHAIVWEEHFGPIPEGHIIIFKDRDRRNFDRANLQCISRAENMRRNTIHRYPPALKQAIRLAGKLNRRIEAAREKQD